MAPNRFNAIAIIGMTAPLAFRRVAPLQVALVTSAVLIFHSLATTRAESAGAFVSILLVVYTVASQLSGRRRIAATLALVIGATVLLANDPLTTSFASALPSISIMSAAWGVGAGVQKRQQRSEELQRRTRQLEVEKERDTRVAAEAERARIARELHDVIAHDLSTIVVQAGAARLNIDASRREREKAILSIEEAARSALSEMRALLGLVRALDDSAELEPQPGLKGLAELCQRVTEAGVPVELSIQDDVEQIPEALELSVYRIVQESLTNVLKHAGGHASARVVLGVDPAGLSIDVTDTGTGPDDEAVGGHGLIGIRERVALYGGEFHAGARPEGGFRVRIRLPLRESMP
jgi:signal transduction histidine kinase